MGVVLAAGRRLGEYLWAIVQGIFWPAFMVYEVFAVLAA